jgi:hypothetical protein
VSGQFGQQLSVERAKQALDLSPALRAADGGVDDPEPEVRRHLVKVPAGEIAAVVDIEHVRHAADRPRRVAPDRVAKRKAGVEHARRAEEHHVPGDRAGAVVDHSGEPGPHRRSALVEDEDVERRVVGLP